MFAVAAQSGVISPDYSVFRKKEPLNIFYFESVLKSSACRRELKIRAKGIVEGFWRLYTDDFYDIRLPVPPVEEQEEITASIRESTTELNTAIRRTEHEIELSEKVITWYIRRTLARVRGIPNIDLENDLQLATAVEEVKKKLMDQGLDTE